MGTLRDARRLAQFMFGSGGAEQIYELLSEYHLGERSLYLNLGYWKDAKTFDEAAQALARELALAVGMQPGDVVADCGFGYADQDLYWATTFHPKRIVGLNVTPAHVEKAKQRVVERGLEQQIELLLGSALEIPLPDGTTDRVTALESSLHFPTREDFMREAFRVLRPGGRLALTDILPREGWRQSIAERVDAYMFRRVWRVPQENFYPPSVYASKLEGAGFKNVEIRSIRDEVYAGYVSFLRSHLKEPTALAGMNSFLRSAYENATADGHFDQYDYVIAVGEKPAVSRAD